MTPQELVNAFESWCRESQIENTFCTQAKNKLAEMIEREMLLTKVKLPDKKDVEERFGKDPYIEGKHDRFGTPDGRIREGVYDCYEWMLDAIEKAFEKWMATEGTKACEKICQAAVADTEKRLLLSRVELPTIDKIHTASCRYNYHSDDKAFAKHFAFKEGAEWYRDNLNLVPINLDEIMPSQEEFYAQSCAIGDSCLLYEWLRQHIQAAIGGK